MPINPLRAGPVLIAAALASASCSSHAGKMAVAVPPVASANLANGPDLTLIDEQMLAVSLAEVAAGNPYFTERHESVLRAADAALKFTADPVTNKTVMPPSGDLNDYLSLAPYWWPDADKPDGLPWLRRDGEVNPMTRGRNTDQQRQSDLFDALAALNMGYLVSGNDAYSNKAAELIRVWYLDPATRVNPHLEYGQGVPGSVPGRPAGVIEWSSITDVITAVEIGAHAGTLSSAELAGMREWFAQYLQWLETSEIGMKEDRSVNNHGSWYDVAALALQLHLGMDDAARARAEAAKVSRIEAQLDPDGAQPHESRRTKSVNYNSMNLRAMAQVALLAREAGVDLLSYRGKDGENLLDAYRFLVPYAQGEQEWPHRQITGGGVQPAIEAIMLPMLLVTGTKLDQQFLSEEVQRKVARDLPATTALLAPPEVMLSGG